MNFSAFIRSRRAGDNPRGDFIRDCRRDPHFPPDIETLSDLRSYLMQASACDEAWAEARALWVEYGGDWIEEGEDENAGTGAPPPMPDTRAKIEAVKANLRAGMSPEDARHAVATQFGTNGENGMQSVSRA
jgi:hypothetical protein